MKTCRLGCTGLYREEIGLYRVVQGKDWVVQDCTGKRLGCTGLSWGERRYIGVRPDTACPGRRLYKRREEVAAA